MKKILIILSLVTLMPILSIGCKTNGPVNQGPQIINTNINIYLPPVSYS